MAAFTLVIIGALNLGLAALVGFDVINTVFGAGSVLVNIIYILIGVSAVYLAATHMADCKHCSEKKK